MKGFLAPCFGRSYPLKQAKDEVRKVEQNVRKNVVNRLVEIIVGIILKNEIEVLWRSLKLDTLDRDQVHCVLEKFLETEGISLLEQRFVDELGT